MARPAKLSSTCGCESRQGKSYGRLVADPSAGERSPVPSGVTKAFLYRKGASLRPVTKVNPRRRLDRVSTERAGRPSRACHGEGNRLRNPSAVDQPRTCDAGLLRGRGDGTQGWPTAEQERPSSVILQWVRLAYKAESESASCRKGVRWGRSTGEARTNNLAEGRAPTLIRSGETGGPGDCPPQRLADSAQLGRSPRFRGTMQGRVVRSEPSFPKIIGKPCAGNPHARFEREGLS